jgi:hypothetical protein
MDSDLEQLATARSEARGHPVAVVQIGDGEAAVLDYDDASKPYPPDTTSDEWSSVGEEGLWRGREAGRVTAGPEYPDAA